MALDKPRRIHNWLESEGTSAYLADGFEKQILGIAMAAGTPPRVVYDYTGCLKSLESRGMNPGEAQEYFDFNTLGAYVGEGGPLYLVRVEDMDE